MKIAINKSYGGFVLSDKGMKRYAELANMNLVYKDGEFYTDFVDPDNLYVGPRSKTRSTSPSLMRRSPRSPRLPPS